MNLFIDYAPESCGKSNFLLRLCKELGKLGVRIGTDPHGADVALLISRRRSPEMRCPRVIRMDGIDLLDTPGNRRKISEVTLPALNESSAVIFQSEFAKDTINALVPHRIPPDRQFVVFNGGDPTEFSVNSAPSDHVHNVLLAAQWFRNGRERLYKRLDGLVEFIRHYARAHPDTAFWVAGATNPGKTYVDNEQIKFLGNLAHRDLLPYLSLAQTYLHMPEFSWCDNSLVEAICAKCHPIGSNIGGNAEVIRTVEGTIVENDRAKTPAFVGDYSPAPILWDALEPALEASRNAAPISWEAVSIAQAAQRYLAIFESVLG